MKIWHYILARRLGSRSEARKPNILYAIQNDTSVEIIKYLAKILDFMILTATLSVRWMHNANVSDSYSLFNIYLNFLKLK